MTMAASGAASAGDADSLVLGLGAASATVGGEAGSGAGQARPWRREQAPQPWQFPVSGLPPVSGPARDEAAGGRRLAATVPVASEGAAGTAGARTMASGGWRFTATIPVASDGTAGTGGLGAGATSTLGFVTAALATGAGAAAAATGAAGSEVLGLTAVPVTPVEAGFGATAAVDASTFGLARFSLGRAAIAGGGAGTEAAAGFAAAIWVWAGEDSERGSARELLLDGFVRLGARLAAAVREAEWPKCWPTMARTTALSVSVAEWEERRPRCCLPRAVPSPSFCGTLQSGFPRWQLPALRWSGNAHFLPGQR